MKDFLLALCVGLMFVLGYFPMRRLDRFLERNREAAERREAAPSPSPEGERARRGRALGDKLPLSGGWRRENWFPLRHG